MEKLRKRTAAAALFLACGMLLAAFTPARAWFGSGETPAAVSAFSKSDGQGQLITFTKEDFLAGVTGEEELSAIVVSALPSGGTLRLAGRDVRPGEAIEAGRLGALCFVPQIGRDVHTSFEFFPVFSRSGAGETAVKVSLNISDTHNSAPIAVEQTFETYADLALHGTLKAVDPDGDACTFSVERQGKRGTAEIDGADFCYTPNGKSGEDTFTVIATDCFGNRSQPAEICVKVVKRAPRETFTYTDMGDNPAHYAALRLREAGVFSGEIFGSEAFFCPAQTVSRAQFLTMAAAIADGIEDFSMIILYGSRTADGILLKDEIEAIAARSGGRVKVVHVLSEDVKEGFEHGFITAELIQKYAPEGGYSVFMCGPKAMYTFCGVQKAGASQAALPHGDVRRLYERGAERRLSKG